MKFNQDFVPSWNALYSALVNKIAKTVITSNVYHSPFSAMVQSMETGTYVEDVHINPGKVLLQDTVTNSDLFTDYTDDLATAIYEVGVDLTFPSSYTEYNVRQGFSLMENVASIISALTANIRTTMELWRNKLVKQMLYNAYQYGMISSVTIGDPRISKDNAGKYAVAINNMIDDFRTEINPRNIIYNNQVGLAAASMRQTICNDIPYVITFGDFVRDVEFSNALNLALIERFKSGNSNQDWAAKLIQLNLADFPNAIPATGRSEVTGNNVAATEINFYEMPTSKTGVDLFSGTPTGGDTVCAYVIDPRVIKLYTQLEITTSWLNPATLVQTNREIYRGIMQLGGFGKIAAITCNSGE